jgi:limonene-1,2-epoxide hydrolase
VSTDNEATVCEFLRAFEGKQLDAAQVDRLLDYMTTDARYHVYAWEEPFVGREAIRAELLKQAPAFSDTEEEILNVASVERTVFLERHDIITMFGKRAAVAVVGVFEVDADGKITSWRDYFDSREIGAKFGEVPEVGRVGTETGDVPT